MVNSNSEQALRDVRIDSEAEQPDEESVVDHLSAGLDADIILYNGFIARPADVMFIEKCVTRQKRTNAVLILVTEGGDPDAAYRIGRTIQENYARFTLFVTGYCKSAGTLIAIGAHELVISDHGELGPLDVQMSKDDELMRTQSGLTVWDTLDALKERADDAFTDFFVNMQERSSGAITLRTATEIATNMATGLFAPLYGQVDPMHVGEARRAMSIGSEYGRRLLSRGDNIGEKELLYLTSAYPSHGFVIDRTEAGTLFNNVREPTEEEGLLASELGDLAIKPTPRSMRPVIEFLSAELSTDNVSNENTQTEENDHETHQVTKEDAIGFVRETASLVAQADTYEEDSQNHTG